MGKLLLSFVLLLLIVGVSYFQAERKQHKVDNSFILGKKANQKEVLALKSAADSLTTKIGQQEVIHAESLFRIDKSLRRNTDSLAEIISLQEQSITELRKKKATLVKPAVAQKTADTEKKHKELLAFYKKRYESLPTDLSEYELKVAVFEIRQETSQKYSISLTELNRIREEFKLNF